MPLDQFDDRTVTRMRGGAARPSLRRQATSMLQALLGDIFYFRWAFAGLGAVMVMATVC